VIINRKRFTTFNLYERGFAQFFIILVGSLVIILAVAFFAINNGQIKFAPEPKETTPTITEDTSNWKTYTNEKYSFQVDYPNEWMVEEVLPNTEENTYSWPPLEVSFAPKPVSSRFVWITIDKSENTLDQYINNRLCDSPGVCASSKNATDLQLSNHPAKKITDAPGPTSTEIILVKRENTIYRITTSYEDLSYIELYSQEQKKTIFNQILSTFRFME